MRPSAFCIAADDAHAARPIVAPQKQTRRDMLIVHNHTLRNIGANGFWAASAHFLNPCDPTFRASSDKSSGGART
jgi:hypothetical protein